MMRGLASEVHRDWSTQVLAGIARVVLWFARPNSPVVVELRVADRSYVVTAMPTL